MDKGAQFIIDNFKQAVAVCKQNNFYNIFYKKVLFLFNTISGIKYTGNMIEYFYKYKKENNSFRNLSFLKEYKIIAKNEVSDYLITNFPNEVNHLFSIKDFLVDNFYSNMDIINAFGCSNVGGMRRSKKHNALVLVNICFNNLYQDKWTKDGILNFTGMGKIGHQSIDFAQNKTLYNSKTNKVKLYLFESYKKNQYCYRGEVELCGNWFTAQEYDKNNNLRTVIKFPLKLKQSNQ